MARLGNILQIETQAGTPATVGNLTVTPESQAFILRLPFGGFVWNRPAAVLLEMEGEQQHIPIVDVTRIAQLALAVFVFGLVIWSRTGERKELKK